MNGQWIGNYNGTTDGRILVKSTNGIRTMKA
jgi:hypothetical protein